MSASEVSAQFAVGVFPILPAAPPQKAVRQADGMYEATGREGESSDISDSPLPPRQRPPVAVLRFSSEMESLAAQPRRGPQALTPQWNWPPDSDDLTRV